jgi:hypothetical protein
MERLQQAGAVRRDAEASDAAVRAMLRSRVNFSQHDDTWTAQQMMMPPDHSPVVAKLLGLARRDLALLEQERKDVLRSIYRDPFHQRDPRDPAASVGEWTLRPVSMADAGDPWDGSPAMTNVFPETASKNRVMLPESPPRAVGSTSYPARSLPPLRGPAHDAVGQAPGLRPHAPRKAEPPGEPRNAAAEIRANAERQMRQLREKGFLSIRARLVLEVGPPCCLAASPLPFHFRVRHACMCVWCPASCSLPLSFRDGASLTRRVIHHLGTLAWHPVLLPWLLSQRRCCCQCRHGCGCG